MLISLRTRGSGFGCSGCFYLDVIVHFLSFQIIMTGYIQHTRCLRFWILFFSLIPKIFNLVCISDFAFVVLLFRPHLWGELYILKWVFFVQTFLAGRYIHRREVLVVSLNSSSSVEFEIKKIFWYLLFSGSYRGLKFCVNTWYLAWFC